MLRKDHDHDSEAKVIRVLIDERDSRTTALLRSRLSPARFELIDLPPGGNLTELARKERPQVVVMCGVDRRTETATREIDDLKRTSPDTKVIAMSDLSTRRDAAIVERGVFYYLARADEEQLARVVEAAAASLSSKGRTDARDHRKGGKST